MSSNWENSKVRDTYFNEFSVLYTLTIYHSVAKRLVSLTSWHLLQFPTGTSKNQIPSPSTIDISKKKIIKPTLKTSLSIIVNEHDNLSFLSIPLHNQKRGRISTPFSCQFPPFILSLLPNFKILVQIVL